MTKNETLPRAPSRVENPGENSLEWRSQAAPAPSQETLPDQPMVCGRSMRVDLTYFPRDEQAGKVLYFRTEYCLRAYRADPHRFYTAHSQARSGVMKKDRIGTE